MKRLSVLFIMVIFFVSGCIYFQVGGEEKEIIASITARRVGCEIQKQYPDIAKQIDIVCKAMFKSDETKDATGELIRLLTSHVDDPLLAADIRDLLSLIKVETEAKITEEQKRLIKAVADNLQKGMEVCNGGK